MPWLSSVWNLWSKQHVVDMFSHVSNCACFKHRDISRRNRITTRETPATGLMFKASQSYSHYFNMCKTKNEYHHVPSKHCCGLQWTSNIKLDQYGCGSKLLPSNASVEGFSQFIIICDQWVTQLQTGGRKNMLTQTIFPSKSCFAPKIRVPKRILPHPFPHRSCRWKSPKRSGKWMKWIGPLGHARTSGFIVGKYPQHFFYWGYLVVNFMKSAAGWDPSFFGSKGPHALTL